LAAALLPLRPIRDGGMGQYHQLEQVVNELSALEQFLALLPRYEGQWRDPEQTRADLDKLLTIAPNNAIVLTALSEVLLQLDRPMQALEMVGKALRLEPNYARAHDVRGTTLLRQNLPALAVEAFNKAIDLSNCNRAYVMHRASAYLMLNNDAAMCEDFRRACIRGDCEVLRWARGMGKCVDGDSSKKKE
jgi:tetratricopeptide (TPR) repeat protein